MSEILFILKQPWWYWIVAVVFSAFMFLLCSIAITLRYLSPQQGTSAQEEQKALFFIAIVFSVLCGFFWQTVLIGLVIFSLIAGAYLFFNKDKL